MICLKKNAFNAKSRALGTIRRVNSKNGRQPVRGRDGAVGSAVVVEMYGEISQRLFVIYDILLVLIQTL